MNKSLYLFTSAFPYSTIENFLEIEIGYLSKHFDRVYIIPQAGKGTPRLTPANCSVFQPLYGEGIDSVFEKYKDFVCLRALSVELREFFFNKVYTSKRRFINWLKFSLQINRLYHNRLVRKIRSQIKPDDICYFYWGVGANMLALLFDGKCHMVSRFHGEWDLWEEMYGGYVPYRNKIADILDRSVFISSMGKNYFDKKYPNHNTIVYPLGTTDFGVSKKSNDGIIRILSCSSVYPLKRVDLICKVVEELANQGLLVKWTHIGGGRDFRLLTEQVSAINNENLSVILLGQVDSANVENYYKKETIDIFVNLSTKEGVPVSIMEAISCDVPVVATNVGATCEVVHSNCGLLVSPNPTIKEVAEAIVYVVNNSDFLSPREYWSHHYNAADNYEAFAKMLYGVN